jgi:hypothetical protein
MQFLTRPRTYNTQRPHTSLEGLTPFTFANRSAVDHNRDDSGYDRGQQGGKVAARRGREEAVWSHAVHRVVTEGISAEQAVDEAIARIKQILAE